MSQSIHPTAIIEAGAQLGNGVNIGPYCTVGNNVKLGDNTRLISHVVIAGETTIGASNTIYPFASLGQTSPDRKYKGEAATLNIGNHNDIREYVTMHIGTGAGGGNTSVGNDNLIMATCHIAHDCIVGNNVTMANGASLAGHVEVDDFATIGGLTGVSQRVRIGTHAFIGGHAAVTQDVPPYGSVASVKAHLQGLNLVGLRRHGFTNDEIRLLKTVYTHMFVNNDETLQLRVQNIAEKHPNNPHIEKIVTFMQNSKRGHMPFKQGKA